jgi:hypothetical protein
LQEDQRQCPGSDHQAERQVAETPGSGEQLELPMVPEFMSSAAFVSGTAAGGEASVSGKQTEQAGHHVVTSLKDCMSWPAHNFDELSTTASISSHLIDSDSESEEESNGEPDDDDTRVAKALIARMNGMSYSTAFSGIDGPGTAYEQMRAELQHRIVHKSKKRRTVLKALKKAKLKAKHLHATEWFGPSQKELERHPCPPECLFDNIEKFLHPSILKLLETLKESGKIMSVLGPVIKAGKACRGWYS